jgi:outer membrane lipoprotein-sorting protein
MRRLTRMAHLLVPLSLLISPLASNGQETALNSGYPDEDPTIPQSVDPSEIIRKMELILRGDASYGIYQMTITDPDWKRTIEFSAWEKRQEKKTFIRVQSPAKEAGNVTLKIGYEMWNYLPRIERVIKVPPSMMMQPWNGSDFSNDDLVKASSVLLDYTHTLLAEEAYLEHAAYKIELLPDPDAPVVWGKILAWVRVKDSMPLRQEYYSENGKLIRTLELADFREVRGRLIPTRWVMTPVSKSGRSTIMEVLDLEIDGEIDDSIFSLRNLKKNP